MVYDQTTPTSIEGGGRIVVATKGGEYTVPANASADLVYVGLNKNFEPITDYLTCYTAEPDSINTDTITTGGSETSPLGENTFKMNWNQVMKAQVYYPANVQASVADSLSSYYGLMDVSDAKSKAGSTLTDITSEIEKTMKTGKEAGFITVVVPEKATAAEIEKFKAVSDKLTKQGVFMTIVAKDGFTSSGYPWATIVLVRSSKEYGKVLSSSSGYLSGLMMGSIASTNNNDEQCPKLYYIDAK